MLNQIRQSLNELKEDGEDFILSSTESKYIYNLRISSPGLLDEKEYEILLHAIEIKMKGLWNTPSYMTPRRPEMVVADLQWVGGSTELLQFLLVKNTICESTDF